MGDSLARTEFGRAARTGDDAGGGVGGPAQTAKLESWYHDLFTKHMSLCEAHGKLKAEAQTLRAAAPCTPTATSSEALAASVNVPKTEAPSTMPCVQEELKLPTVSAHTPCAIAASASASATCTESPPAFLQPPPKSFQRQALSAPPKAPGRPGQVDFMKAYAMIDSLENSTAMELADLDLGLDFDLETGYSTPSSERAEGGSMAPWHKLEDSFDAEEAVAPVGAEFSAESPTMITETDQPWTAAPIRSLAPWPGEPDMRASPSLYTPQLPQRQLAHRFLMREGSSSSVAFDRNARKHSLSDDSFAIQELARQVRAVNSDNILVQIHASPASSADDFDTGDDGQTVLGVKVPAGEHSPKKPGARMCKNDGSIVKPLPKRSPSQGPEEEVGMDGCESSRQRGRRGKPRPMPSVVVAPGRTSGPFHLAEFSIVEHSSPLRGRSTPGRSWWGCGLPHECI